MPRLRPQRTLLEERQNVVMNANIVIIARAFVRVQLWKILSSFFFDWFTTPCPLLTSTTHSLSAHEIQRVVGHRRYQPIWEMVHDLRDVMGKRDGKHIRLGNVETGEDFFPTAMSEAPKGEKQNAGAESQSKDQGACDGTKHRSRQV